MIEEDLIVLLDSLSLASLAEDFLVVIDLFSNWQVSLKYSIGLSCFSLCSSCIGGAIKRRNNWLLILLFNSIDLTYLKILFYIYPLPLKDFEVVDAEVVA